jgi:hypothetical protein
MAANFTGWSWAIARAAVANHVGGQDHMRHLVVGRVVEIHLPRIDGHDPAIPDGEATRLVHPRVDRHHRHRPEYPARGDWHTRPEMRPAAQTTPAVQVDRGEDGFQEEEQPLDAERQPEHPAVPPHQAGPQQAHLERQHRPGDRADRDQHPHRLRPAPGERHRHLVRPPQADELRDQHDGGQRDPQAGQDDVEPKGGRHLGASRDHLATNPRGSDRRDVSEAHDRPSHLRQ